MNNIQKIIDLAMIPVNIFDIGFKILVAMNNQFKAPWQIGARHTDAGIPSV